MKRRLSIILITLTVVIAFALGSWLAGQRIQSPEEVAAQTAPPTPSPILVPIEERPLTSKIVTRGTARFGLPKAISIAPSELKSAAGVIATLPERGTQVKEGDILLVASGRPVFILQGDTPTFRDFRFDAQGSDVTQLEESLKRLGVLSDAVSAQIEQDRPSQSRIYRQPLGKGVEQLYASVDWDWFDMTADQTAWLRELEQQLAAAQNDQISADAAVVSSVLALEIAQLEEQSVFVNIDKLNAQLAVQEAETAQEIAQNEAQLATDAVALIEAEIATVTEQFVTPLPADEVVFVPELPVRIEELNVNVGDEASGVVMLVTNNQLSIDGSLPLDEASLVRPGMAVTIDEPDLGISAVGVVKRVASAPGTDGVDGFHIYFETTVDHTDTNLEGFSLRMTIPVESTEGDVLTVPINALSLAPDGRSRMQIDNEGSLEFVIVEPGLAADGYVEINPVDVTLEAGQLVVIGLE